MYARARAFASHEDEDDGLLSADELVKTLQPVGARRADAFPPPARLPPWHLDDEDAGMRMDGRPKHGEDPARARAFELMYEHQRQAQLHTQQQLRQYSSHQQQHQQLLHRHRQQQHLAASASAMAGPPVARGPAAPMYAHDEFRRRPSPARMQDRGGYEHAHRIHRELQPPPPVAYPGRHHHHRPDMRAVPMGVAMPGSRPTSARRRVPSPASPDFDPHFDLLQFDPAGIDLYDDDMALALPPSAASMEEMIPRSGGLSPSMAMGNGRMVQVPGRRLSRPFSGGVRRPVGPPVASPGAGLGPPPRGFVDRYARGEEEEEEDDDMLPGVGRPRPASSMPPQTAPKRAKTQEMGEGRLLSGDSHSAASFAPTNTASRSKAPAKPMTSKSNGKQPAKPAATKTATPASSGSSGEAASGSVAANGDAPPVEQKRRCGRKSMNYTSEEKRERNRAAVKKCRQRQALKLEYLQHKAEVLQTENQALSDMLVKNVELDDAKRLSLTRGIQMDILLKIKEIFTQSLPKDFVLDADSIWDLNSVLAVSMPSRCYYGIESIKDFWRTSLRMRNKGKIRSFWAWLFRLPPGDRFSEFVIEPFSPTSSLYFISWTTKSDPPLAGSMVIMFGHGHRVTLHVECFGWLIWRYLLTNEPFPEPPME